MEMAEKNIKWFLKSEEFEDSQSINRYILDNISYRLDEKGADLTLDDEEEIKGYLFKKIEQGLAEQEKNWAVREA